MPYTVKGFFKTAEDIVQILLMLEILFTQDSKVEEPCCQIWRLQKDPSCHWRIR